MEVMRQITSRVVRQREPLRSSEWVACEIEGGYTLRSGDALLYTINESKPRVFKTLDALKKALKRELGVTEFKVEALK